MAQALEEKTVATARIRTPETRASLIALVNFTEAKVSPALEALINEWPHLPQSIQERIKARALGLPLGLLEPVQMPKEQVPSLPPISSAVLPAAKKVERPNARTYWKDSARRRYAGLLALWDQGRTVPEMAAALRTTPKAVRNRITRARTQWGLFKAQDLPSPT